MSDPRFFRPAGPFSLAELALAGKAQIGPNGPGDARYADIAPLDVAGPTHVAFLDNPKYAGAFETTKAGACIVRPDMVARAPEGIRLLVTPQPYHCFARIAQLFYPIKQPLDGIAPSATIDPTASLGDGCAVAPGAVIGANAAIGRNCDIGPNSVIGPGVQIGDDCAIGANASVTYALIGNRVRIFAGAQIGEDGFGFAMDPAGHIRIPQLGRVIIEDDVEIGANSCVDRGSSGNTVIGKGTMIDNLVQIAHNVQIGRGCVFAGQAGVARQREIRRLCCGRWPNGDFRARHHWERCQNIRQDGNL